MLTCDPESLSQDVRAVCQTDGSDCDHVYLNGAEGTIVRLPEDVCVNFLLPIFSIDKPLFLSVV